MSDTMSGTPPRAPTLDPGIEEDRQGPLEFFNVIKVKKPPMAFEQNGITRYLDTTLISMGQDLRSVESCQGPNDKSAAKIKTPGLETQRSLMWESHVQHCAICHGGVATRPSQTSNAESRDHSTLHIGAGPHKYVAGATAPATVTGPSAAPPSPLPARPPQPPPRVVTTPVENFQRGIKCGVAHCEESKRDEQWDEWSRTFIAMIDTHGRKNVIDLGHVNRSWCGERPLGCDMRHVTGQWTGECKACNDSRDVMQVSESILCRSINR